MPDPTGPAKRQPDPATLKRLVSLGRVGTALWERSNDNTFDTDYLIAIQDLADFEAGLNELEMEPVVAKGMHDLISYLRTKLDKRLRSSQQGTTTLDQAT